MNRRRLFSCVIAVCLAVPVTAGAAELTIFEGPNFQGRSVTLTGDMQNLDGTGFNDRTSSIIVREGIWEVCVDAYFQGGCTQFRPGEYTQLDGRFNRSISSLRVLQGQLSYRSQIYSDPGYSDGEGYRDRYYRGNRGDGYDRGYYGYPYRDHGQ